MTPNVTRDLQQRVAAADLDALTHADVTAAATLLSIDDKELCGQHTQLVDTIAFAAIAALPAGPARASAAALFGSYYTGDAIRLSMTGTAFKIVAGASPDTLARLAALNTTVPGGARTVRALVSSVNTSALAAATIIATIASVKAPRATRTIAIAGAVHAARRTMRHRAARARSQQILARAANSGWWDEWLLGRRTTEALVEATLG